MAELLTSYTELGNLREYDRGKKEKGWKKNSIVNVTQSVLLISYHAVLVIQILTNIDGLRQKSLIQNSQSFR